MKNLFLIIGLMVLPGIFNTASATAPEDQNTKESIQVWYSADLQEVVLAFVEAYKQEHGLISMQVNQIEPGSLLEMNGKAGQIAILTKADLEGLDSRLSRLNVIGREVYVPVMNSQNPYSKEIIEQGLSPREFALMYSKGKGLSWGGILNNEGKAQVNACRATDPSFTSYLSSFIETDQEAIGGREYATCEEVLSVVKNDKNALGFCTLTQLTRMKNSGELKSLAMVPVDLNDNNQIDHFEEIYGSVEDLSRGIWIGKYSGALYSRVFVVSSLVAAKGPEQEFIKWMATGGQEILADMGYSSLSDGETEAVLANIENTAALSISQSQNPKLSSFNLLLLSIVLGGGILITIVLLIFNHKAETEIGKTGLLSKPIVSSATDIPGGYFFDRSHTWTFLEKDGNIRIGIDSFLQKVMGPITKVDLKSPGEKVSKGETIVVLMQNGKRLDITSPIKGLIQKQNSALLRNSSLINSSPYSEGWLYLVEPLNWADEFGLLFRGQKYSEWIKAEFGRLKDFLINIIQPDTNKALILQEGGELTEGVLQDLGPAVWEEFQTSFLRN